jgi:hypothetical protein
VPAFIAFIVSAITSVFSYFVKTYGRKLTVGVLFIAAYISILTLLVTTLNSEFSKLAASLPNDSFLLAGLSLVPSNAITCCLVIIGVRSAGMFYALSTNVLKIKLLS